jgi:hypothetical protein
MNDVTNLPVHPAAGILPMLEGEEFRQLVADIAENGLREPVWLWRDPETDTNYLLDGRNRAAACREAGIEVQTRWYEGASPVRFVVSYNLRHRHLTEGQKASVGYRMVPLLEVENRQKMARAAADENRRRAAERAAEREKSAPSIDFMSEEDVPGRATWPTPDAEYAESGDWYCEGGGHPESASVASEQVGSRLCCPQCAEDWRAPKEPPQRTRDVAAETAGTSGRSVGRYKRIAEKAPDLAKKVDKGELELGRADRIIRDREAEQRRVDQAKVEASKMGDVSTVDIRHGDFRDVLADLTGVDAIITDPPYPHEFIPLLGDLALWADKALRPDGIMAILIGQTYLPEVYRLLDTGRPYRWTACYLTSGPGYVSHPRKVQSNWKPLIVYGGGPRFSDVVRSEGTDAGAKDNHKWGQDYAAFHTIVERLTERGQTVVDPFMGSGTTLLAAHAMGRNAIGCDVDEVHVAKSRERLG